ncbi:MAG TPA: glutathione S-transferase family protein [Gaiellaceae bacterium]|nr:glutathione S-transferase family protein [Gaiellaceae bacterium]
MLTLYDYAGSGNCYKVRLLLAQLARDYERVPVDIFAGESTTPEHLARNPAGRTPVLELPSGETIAESNAILLYLGEGTPFVPAELLPRARVWQWLFFEQNLVEPNIGTARFWRLTGRDVGRAELLAARVEGGKAALETLERYLAGRRFLVDDRYTVADVSLFAYVHVADEAGIDMSRYAAVRAWLEEVRRTPRFLDDLDSYLPSARAGSGGRSVHG